MGDFRHRIWRIKEGKGRKRTGNKVRKISEYLLLHCEVEKFLYLTGGTILECKYGDKQVAISPTDHNVQVDGKLAVASTDCRVGEHMECFGICRELSRKERTSKKCEPKIAHGRWLNTCLGMKIGNENGLNEDSYLVCTRCEGAIIKPVLVPGGAGGENVRECSASLVPFLKCWETGGIRPNLQIPLKSMIYLAEGEYAEAMYYDSENQPT